jgi:hypothetical protein
MLQWTCQILRTAIFTISSSWRAADPPDGCRQREWRPEEADLSTWTWYLIGRSLPPKGSAAGHKQVVLVCYDISRRRQEAEGNNVRGNCGAVIDRRGMRSWYAVRTTDGPFKVGTNLATRADYCVWALGSRTQTRRSPAGIYCPQTKPQTPQPTFPSCGLGNISVSLPVPIHKV